MNLDAVFDVLLVLTQLPRPIPLCSPSAVVIIRLPVLIVAAQARRQQPVEILADKRSNPRCLSRLVLRHNAVNSSEGIRNETRPVSSV